MSAQSESTESLFIALANVEEASRCAREILRQRTNPLVNAGLLVNSEELATALRLINDITKQMGTVVWAHGRALYDSRGERTASCLHAPAYATARELHTLAAGLRRGPRIGNSITAATTLDSAVRDWQASRKPGGGA